MKRASLLVIAVIGVLLFFLSFRTGAVDKSDVVPDAKDSQLLVKNNIHKVRSVSETEVHRRNDWDVYYIGEGDTFLPPAPAIERVVTWTEYDRKGRKVFVIDSSSASDNYHALKLTTHRYGYQGGKLTSVAVKEWYESDSDTGKTSRVILIDNTTWTSTYTLHHTEEQDAGQWNVHIDSTVYNADGQKRITYTYNSMGDSFVEEFTYDAKARLKYRRLTMKQFWSPPWELESTTYRYNDDGSKVVFDSAWRIDPDMYAARKRAGNRKARDYKWRVIAAAPATGTFNRMEDEVEWTYNATGKLVRYNNVGSEDYKWLYDRENKLILYTELRGADCTDSIWYEYKNGIRYHEKVRRYCNTYFTSYDDTFRLDGVPVDPDRSFSFKYEDKEYGIVKVVTQYEHNRVVKTDSFNEKGLMIRSEGYSFYRDLTVTKYTYFTW